MGINGSIMMKNSQPSIHIKQWAAWAPGIYTPEQWTAWAQKPQATCGDDVPNVSDLPAMQRRRMNRLSKMCYVVTQAIEGSAHLPQIYCSRHGDLLRSTQLLEQLAQNEPLSSTSFGLSVHNAAGASVSILQQNTQPITSIAAGKNGIKQAFYEVLSHLVQYTSVVLIVYDDEVPVIYQLKQTPVFAYALLIERGDSVTLDFTHSSHNALPAELFVLAQIIQKSDTLKLSTSP
jgi:hypothetical protein